ncbi:MAG: hypothetical protein ACLSFT_08955 [Ruminococcus callidus]
MLGCLPQLSEVQLESRHLGLMTAGEVSRLDEKVRLLGKTAEETMQLDQILELARKAPPLPEVPLLSKPQPSFRLGIAQDRAFCFYYAENLELLEHYAELVPFSPLEDAALPENLDGLYFGGGYPESYLPQLSGNTLFLESLRQAAETGIPIWGECGGFLYLQQSMAGKRRHTLSHGGTAVRRCGTGRTPLPVRVCHADGSAGHRVRKAGASIPAHEFHYADSTANGNAFLVQRPNGKTWEAMQCRGNIWRIPHLYFPANPEFPMQFAAACRAYRKKRGGIC